MCDPDREDIQAALAGDGDAYGQLVERHQSAVARRMWRFTRDRQVLEELVADVFVEAYRSLGSFAGKAPFSHWLGVIGTRVGYRYWKDKAKRADRMPLQEWDRPQDASRAPGPAEQVETDDSARQLHETLDQLPPRDRMVLTLLYLDDLSVAEAAEQTGWSQTMVKVQAHRARKKLRALLDAQAR